MRTIYFLLFIGWVCGVQAQKATVRRDTVGRAEVILDKKAELDAVVVTGVSRAISISESPLAMKTVSTRDIEQVSAANVIDAIEGKCDLFENPDGTPRQPANDTPRNSGCAA
mgnify:CR=1 FL=1